MDLDELKRLLEQATPGPWIGAGPSFGDPLPRYTTSMVTEWEDEDGYRTICEFGYAHHDEENEANAALIAALRNHAEELVRDARRYRWLRDVGFRSANLSLGVDSDGQDFAEFAFEFRAPESEYQMREPEDWSAGDVNAAIDAAIAQEQP